jgi:glycosyltransferase involved in cell wall biosynthesis
MIGIDSTINIAVMIKSDLKSGGGFQYEYMVLDILKKHHDTSSKINIKFFTLNSRVVQDYQELGLDIILINENFINKIHRFTLSNLSISYFLNKIKIGRSFVENFLLKDKIDLVYFLSPDILSLGLSNIPYIFTLWDLGHLENMEFPEVSHNRVFEQREYLYSKSLKKSFKVIVDSNYSKEYTIDKYNLDSKRLEVLKYLPNIRISNNGSPIDIKKKYGLNNDYIFYPAQFWAHKNHVYILEAIKILKSNNILIDVIFSGSDKGTLEYILKKAESYGIDNLVHYIGFAPNEEMPYLYEQSLALVMPTYLGPTNIPPLEAFAYRTPVCYSDTPFFHEQVGNAVFYMDLTDPNSLVGHLLTLLEKDECVQRKIENGALVLKNWDERGFYQGILKVLNSYGKILTTWK